MRLPRPQLPRLDPRAAALLIAGFGLYAVYLGYTGVLDRNSDASTHLLYVRYVADHLAPPPRGTCNVCHHPPFYYVVAAVVLRALTWAGASDAAYGLQVLSLVLVGIFVLCAAFSIEPFVLAGPSRLVATALVVFWPYTVLNVARVGNDAMLYAISGGVLLALSVFHQEGSRRALWTAGALAVLGLCTKASAIALVGIVIAVAGLSIFRAPDRRALARTIAPVLAVVLAATALQGFVGRGASAGFAGNVLGSAYEIPAAWRTPRTARFYLTFDPRAYAATPYATLVRFNDGEPTYWNHLVKSSLFGTRRGSILAASQPEKEPSEIASAMNLLLLALLAFLCAGQVLGLRKPSRERAFAAVTAAVFAGVGLGFHLLVPYAYHADFRFIYPIVLPLAVLYAQAVEWVGERHRALRHLGHGLAGLMVILSIAYFVPITWHERPSRRFVPVPELGQPPSRRPSLLVP